MPVKIDALNLPSVEAIAFLRNKLNIPTEHWDDFVGDLHAKGFAVAGAVKADLLREFHEAIEEMLEEGGSIGDFRERFDDIVARHGWMYNGERGWRTRVIYDNNLRTAHMAGRWAQIQETKETRPYLQYRTAGDEQVRPEHRDWDGTVLPVDDPFWDTHYPPNDYGCRCTIRTLSVRQIEKQGLSISDRPTFERKERISTRTGEVLGNPPDGIGVGWDYNVGKAWLAPEQAFAEKLAALPPHLRDGVFCSSESAFMYSEKGELPLPGSPASLARWHRAITDTGARGEWRPLAYLSSRVLDAAGRFGVDMASGLVIVEDRVLRLASGNGFAQSDAALLLQAMASPDAVYLDSESERLYMVVSTDQQLVIWMQIQPGEEYAPVQSAVVVSIADVGDLGEDWASGFIPIKGGL